MNEEARKILCEMIEHYGRGLCNDSRRCSALLKDHCGQYKREIFALISALEHGVTENLINAPSGTPSTILIPRLSKQLEDELGLAENVAKWAVETWALALKRISHPIAQTKTSVAQNTSDNSAISTSTQQAAQIQANTNPGGQLKFPSFSVGTIKFGSQQMRASGIIDVPAGHIVEFIVADDVNDFSFFHDCDSSGLVWQIDLSRAVNFFEATNIPYRSNYTHDVKDIEESLLKHDLYNSQWSVLSNIKNIISLKLNNCDWIHFKDLEKISKIPNLERLELNMARAKYNNWISDNGIMCISGCHTLKWLDLTGCLNITGLGAVQHLGQMKNLEYLNISRCTNISSVRLQELKDMLPNTTIVA